MSSSERYWRRRVFAVTWLTYAGFYLCRKNFAVAMPLLTEDLDYTKLELATVISVFSLFYAGGQFGGALLSDRFGARLVVGIGMMVSAASNIAMGFAGSLMAFTLLAPLNGLGQSTGWPGLVKTMASWFRPRERGVVMGWWGTSFVLGGAFATAFATFWVSNETFLAGAGWRRGFFFPALALGAVAVLFMVLVRNRPADVGLDSLEVETGGSRVTGTTTSLLRSTLAEPALWAIAAMYFFLKSTRYAFLFWLPLYMYEALHYSEDEAGYTSALYELVGFSGAIFAGYVSDKLAGSRRFPRGIADASGSGTRAVPPPVLLEPRPGRPRGLDLFGGLLHLRPGYAHVGSGRPGRGRRYRHGRWDRERGRLGRPDALAIHRRLCRGPVRLGLRVLGLRRVCSRRRGSPRDSVGIPGARD